MSEIHVAFALHDSKGDYWPNLAVAITSLCHNSSRELVVHLLHDQTLGIEALSSLRAIVKCYNHHLALHPVDLAALLHGLDFGQFSVGSAFRLVLPKVLSHLPRFIYFDSDIVFNGFDVNRFDEWFYSQPLENPFEAVHDDLFSASPSQAQELDMLGLPASEYVNSGVLVMRPPMIPGDLIRELLSFVKKYPQAYHKDQDLINSLYAGRIGMMPANFNYQVNLNYGRLFLGPGELEGKVLHFTGKIKPLSGLLAPGHLPFWRYSQFVPQISRFFPAEVAYLQKIHSGSSHARKIPSIAPIQPSSSATP